MELVALDLEGTGAQDRADEAILEIALVPIVDRRPDIANSYSTLVNPGRIIPRRPWISPGLTNNALASAPPLSDVEPRLADGLNDKYIVGHNVRVDWRLIHLRCPSIQPAGLIDTLRLARSANRGSKKNLSALVDQFELTDEVNRSAAGSQPHRALWDAVAAALVLHALATRALGPAYSASELLAPASILLEPKDKDKLVHLNETQETLFD